MLLLLTLNTAKSNLYQAVVNFGIGYLIQHCHV